MKAHFPSISIIIPTLNASKILPRCLESIRNQDYPQEQIEILLVDGGSTDNTKEVGEKYGAVFVAGGHKDNQEARKGIGLRTAKGEFACYIDSDNILPNKTWMNQMTKPLLADRKIVGAETWRYGVDKTFGDFSRYCALIGANDPVVLYLDKCDKLAWLYDEWRGRGVISDNKDYLVVKFDEHSLLTMGGNGFMVRRDILLKSDCAPEHFFHIDVVLDIVKMGYDTFAMVKNEINHDTAASLGKLTRRRVTYFKEHNPATKGRRYLIFNPKKPVDVLRLGIFVLCTLTLLQPLLFSLRGYLKVKDRAWFLHPIACWSFLLAYGVATLGVYLNPAQKS